jgi:hypothetical protein
MENGIAGAVADLIKTESPRVQRASDSELKCDYIATGHPSDLDSSDLFARLRIRVDLYHPISIYK